VPEQVPLPNIVGGALEINLTNAAYFSENPYFSTIIYTVTEQKPV
jgi:hypothetical protein